MISIDWIYNRYMPTLLVVGRHPCDVILSDLNQGTKPKETLEALLRQPMLIDNHIGLAFRKQVELIQPL